MSRTILNKTALLRFQPHRSIAAGLGNVIFGALSQAFFTLSIGIGAMEIFGSYMGKECTLAGESINILILDTFVALMAGLIIIPACFAFNVEPGAGPGLVFITLPNVFNQMAGGRLWGALFFLFMSFAALSTVIAVFENILLPWYKTSSAYNYRSFPYSCTYGNWNPPAPVCEMLLPYSVCCFVQLQIHLQELAGQAERERQDRSG